VSDEGLAVRPGASLQIAGAEGMDQQLGLVEPRRPRRSQPGAPPTVAPIEVSRRRSGDVARATVVDQVDAPESAMPAAELFQGRDVVRRVLLLQGRNPHPPGVNDQEDQEVHGAMPGVVEFPLLDRAADGPADRLALKDLEVGHLIGADDPIAASSQPLSIPVAPEDVLGAGLEPGVEASRPPVASAVGFEVHPVEDQADSARADRLGDAIGDGLAGQILTRPVGDMQAAGDRLRAGQFDDPGALEGGNPGRSDYKSRLVQV
jgi:hypothetical protein